MYYLARVMPAICAGTESEPLGLAEQAWAKYSVMNSGKDPDNLGPSARMGLLVTYVLKDRHMMLLPSINYARNIMLP